MRPILFFIGYMGVGKSHAASRLASLTGLEALDLDEAVEASEGATVAQLFQSAGESAFRIAELRALKGAVQHEDVQIVACGGGTPSISGALDWMKSSGHVIHLNLPFEVILSRLMDSRNAQQRPLLYHADGTAKSAAELRSHWQARALHYAEADEVLNHAPETSDFQRWAKMLR